MIIRKRIIACMVLCFMMICMVCPVAGAAAGIEARDVQCRLALEYKYDGKAVPDANFFVFQVGNVAADGKMSLTGDFAGYPVEINGLTSDAFQTAANNLYDYAQKDKLIPDYIMTTDAEGKADVSGLAQGLYLVAGQNCKIGDTEYVSQPQLVALPYKANAESAPNTDVTMLPKCAIKEEEPEPLTLKVLKKWDDKGNVSKRPSSLTVYLLKNGEVYSTVKLTEKDSWRYTWTDLDPKAVWSVVEDVPDDYTVSVSKQGITFVVTNKYDAPPPPSTTPSDKIPQTGLLWWPVPVLMVLGIAMIVVGSVHTKRSK